MIYGAVWHSTSARRVTNARKGHGEECTPRCSSQRSLGTVRRLGPARPVLRLERRWADRNLDEASQPSPRGARGTGTCARAAQALASKKGRPQDICLVGWPGRARVVERQTNVGWPRTKVEAAGHSWFLRAVLLHPTRSPPTPPASAPLPEMPEYPPPRRTRPVGRGKTCPCQGTKSLVV